MTIDFSKDGQFYVFMRFTDGEKRVGVFPTREGAMETFEEIKANPEAFGIEEVLFGEKAKDQ